MKNELNNIESKINKLDDRLDKIDVHLGIYNEQLKIHIKRTEMLEEDMEPITKHVHEVSAMFKLLGAAAAFTGLFTVLKPMFDKMFQ